MTTETRPDKKANHAQIDTHPYAWRIHELEHEEEIEGNEMRVLLRKVAIKKKLNPADQLQWINAVETKLKLINWDGVSRVRSEILTVNADCSTSANLNSTTHHPPIHAHGCHRQRRRTLGNL
jgi:hypothetical protein